MSNFDRNFETVNSSLEDGLRKLEKRRILTNLSLVLFIVIDSLAFAQFTVFLILFIVKTVTQGFALLYLILFILPVIVAGFDSLWFIFKVIGWRRKYRRVFKETALVEACGKLIDNLEFDPSKGIDKSVVESSEIISKGNVFRSEDLLTGSYRGVQFTRADVSVLCKLEVDGKVQGAVLGENFKGQWLIYDFNKPIDAYVRVIERRGVKGANVVGFTMAKAKHLQKAISANSRKLSNVERVELEDVEFNRKFEVVTRNTQTAFYILTPHFMEAVKYLEKQVEGQLMLAFLDGKLHVAINNYNSEFEPHLAKNPKKNARMIARQVIKTTKFIDLLQLDNDYFKPLMENRG